MNEDTFLHAACDAFSTSPLVVAVVGEEAIGALPYWRIWLSVLATEDTEQVGGSAFTLTMKRGDEAWSHHGEAVACERADVVGDRVLVRVEVKPRMHVLGSNRHHRVFTAMTAREIIAEVFEAAGFSAGEDFDDACTEAYPTRAHTVQYEESDLAFVTRLMAEEGMFFFFAHEDRDKLMVVDAVDGCGGDRVVGYHPVPGGDPGRDAFERVQTSTRLVSRAVRLTDFDEDAPARPLDAEQSTGASGAMGDVVDHGGGISGAFDIDRLAKVRAERCAARAHEMRASGMVFGLRSGECFSLEQHPNPQRNQRYFAVTVEHRGCARIATPELRKRVGLELGSRDVLRVAVGAVPADTPYRMAAAAAAPRLPAVEHGVIDGPADGDYAQLDDAGRYVVKLGFDETDRQGEDASKRMAMLQPHAGEAEGWHFPLRKKTEVLVGFINGDGGRPVIVGSVPNAETPSPVVEGNNTRNLIVTGGTNHIEVEDTDGEQWIDIASPVQDSRFHLGKPHDDDSHHVVGHTDGNARFSIGGAQDIDVGGSLTETVQSDVTERYNTSQESTVGGAQTTVVGGAVADHYLASHSTTTTGSTVELYGATQSTLVGAARFETLASSHSVTVSGAVTQTFGTHDFSTLGASIQGVGSKVTTVAGAGLYDFGPTNQLFGPTTFINGTCTIDIPGACDVFSAEWKLAIGSETFSASVRNHVLTSGVEVVGLGLGLVGAKASATEIAIEVTGAKIESVGLSIGLFGFKMSLLGMELRAYPAQNDGSGFNKVGV